MHTIRYNRKRIGIAVVCVIILFFFISSRYNEYEIEGIIKNTKPEIVWEFVADFSKMKKLNPTILEFKIIADTGTYDHWKYSVEYKERMDHWPYYNVGHGDYAVRKFASLDTESDVFVVQSKHKTCFFKGLYCLKAEGEFKFIAKGKDTHCVERVWYQCPPLLGFYCKKEVQFQRKAIMHNLTAQFQK